MKILRVSLDKNALLALPKPERIFFIALGHITNEINGLSKFSYWAANSTNTNDDLQEHGQKAAILILMRILAGKLNEAWELLRKNFFGPALSKTYEPVLDKEASTALNNLKKYFRKENAAHLLRNHLSFHYSADEIAASINNVDEELVVYLDKESAPNNLFYFSETMVIQAIITLLNKTESEHPLEELTEELFNVAAWFVTLADGLMDAIMQKNVKELRSGAPRYLTISNLPDFQKVSIPWFTETSSLVAVIKKQKAD